MNILVCHGYEIYPDGSLSTLCNSVCQLIAKHHHAYDQIFLLAGQHLHGAKTTVDQAMKNALIQYSVPENKCITWSTLCPEQRPPRDTMEEVDLLPVMLRTLGYRPKNTPFDVACIWYFHPRIRFLFQQRGARVIQILGAPSHDMKRMAIELIAYCATRWSPDGKSEIFRKNRAARNVFETQPNGQPWRDNLSSAWEE